jgi:WS/DGAT/MGAT family acyltransferase
MPASPDAAALAAWSAGDELSDLEALMWRAESDTRLRSDIVVLYLLDRAPDWGRLRTVHARHILAVPRFRQRVVEDPLRLSPPHWEQAEVDLSHHLRRVSLPTGAGEAELLELAAGLHMAPLDAARPLWQAVLVEGLPDGRAAYLQKIHHAITDGSGAIALFEMLYPTGPDAADEPVLPTVEATTAPPDRMAGVRSLTRLAREAGGLAWRGVARPDRALAYARSLRRVMTTPASPSPLLRRRGLSRRLRMLECPLADLRAAAKAAGGSVNDAYLAALLGGLAHYHAKHGTPIGDVPMALPINLRAATDTGGGNNFAGAYLAGPAGEPDPARRIALVRERVRAARDEPALDFLGATAPLTSRLPSGLLASITLSQSRNLDLQASNVAGLSRPAYLAGARIERMFPFGPAPGCAIMAVMLTHAGTCCLTFVTDHEAVSDPDLLNECMRQGFDEILALGSR